MGEFGYYWKNLYRYAEFGYIELIALITCTCVLMVCFKEKVWYEQIRNIEF